MKKQLLTTVLALALIVGLLATPAISRDTWDTKNVQVTRATATGAVAVATTLAPGVAFRIIEVRIHLSAASATSENFTIALDSYAGAAYDAVILSQDLNGSTDFVWVPAERRYFHKTDELDFAWANTDTRTYGLEILYEPVQ